MTYEEAIKALQNIVEYWTYRPEEVETAKLAISALEKQIPKKPVLYGDSEDGKLLCPNCDEDLWEVKECGFNACPYCSQAIDWSDDK